MNIMLDLETYSSGRDAAIRSIGACLFDPYTGELGDEVVPNEGTFHWGVDLAASCSPGVIDPRTVDWWMEQPDSARLALMRLQKASLEEVLAKWHVWVDVISRSRKVRLWSNGPLFDERVLREAFDRCSYTFPIHWRESRDFRTIVDLASFKGLGVPIPIEPGAGVKHDALADCFRQAGTVITSYKLLGLSS